MSPKNEQSMATILERALKLDAEMFLFDDVLSVVNAKKHPKKRVV